MDKNIARRERYEEAVTYSRARGIEIKSIPKEDLITLNEAAEVLNDVMSHFTGDRDQYRSQFLISEERWQEAENDYAQYNRQISLLVDQEKPEDRAAVTEEMSNIAHQLYAKLTKLEAQSRVDERESGRDRRCFDVICTKAKGQRVGRELPNASAWLDGWQCPDIAKKRQLEMEERRARARKADEKIVKRYGMDDPIRAINLLQGQSAVLR